MKTIKNYTVEQLVDMIQTTKVFNSNIDKYTDGEMYEEDIHLDIVNEALNELSIEHSSDDIIYDDIIYDVAPDIRLLLATDTDNEDYIPAFNLNDSISDVVKELTFNVNIDVKTVEVQGTISSNGKEYHFIASGGDYSARIEYFDNEEDFSDGISSESLTAKEIELMDEEIYPHM